MKKLFLFSLVFLFLSISTTHSQSLLKQNIYFKSDDHALDDSNKVALQNLKQELQAFNDYAITIVGHTDQDGSEEYNMILSKKRAEEVKKYFTEIGLVESNIQFSFLGETDLAKNSLDADSKQLNRRVTVEVEGFSYSNVSEMVSQLELDQNNNHTIDQNMETNLLLKQGTEVKIPPNAFCNLDGSPLDGSAVEMTFKEAFEYADMVDQQLSTRTKDRLLETGGMIYIEASQNGKPLKLQDGKQIELLFPEQEQKDGMELFVGQNTEDGMIWEETGEPISSKSSNEDAPFVEVDLSPLLELEIEESDLGPLSFAPMPSYPHPARIAYPPYRENYTEEEYVEAYKKYEAVMEAHELDKVDRPERVKAWITEAERRKNIIFNHKRNFIKSKIERKLTNNLARLKVDQHRISHDKLVRVLFTFLDSEVGNIEYNDWYYTKLAFGGTVVDARKQINLDYPVFRYYDAHYFFPELADAIKEVNFRITEKKYEMGIVDEAVMSRYVVASSKLGWINCDRFYEMTDFERTNLEFASNSDDEQFYLIFKNSKTLLRAEMDEGKASFNGVPKGEDVRLVVVAIEDGNVSLALNDFTIESNKGLKLNYRRSNINGLRKALEI